MIKRIYLEITNACNLNCPFCENEKGHYFMPIDIIKDCLKLVQLAQKDATPLANIDKKFKIVVHFGNMLAMTVDMKLISFNSEASLGDLPIVSISFAK